MKKYILALAIGIVGCLGFSAAPASAGNCYSQAGPGDAQLVAPAIGFRASVFGCTDVRRVQWGDNLPHGVSNATGWIWDSYTGVVHNTNYAGAMTQNIVGPGNHSVVYYQYCWWGGGWQYARWLSNNFNFRIESINVVPGSRTIYYTWGGWHEAWASNGYQYSC